MTTPITTPLRRQSVFVTGTDTGIGKTLTCAALARAWDAEYWKPLQTGLAEEEGDSPTVATLARLAPERIHPPAFALRAPLAPLDAARAEGLTLPDATHYTLPAATRPLIVEGAGGLMVPIAEHTLLISLIAHLALPVILVARGTLGTINHTLLSLEALRARAIPVLGVVFSGALTQGNRDAIETFGQTRTLFHLPPTPEITPQSLAALAQAIPG